MWLLTHSLFRSSHFLSLSSCSPLPVCVSFSILLCSNFPSSSKPVWLWCLITILADISFHFLSSSPVLFLASPPHPKLTTTHPSTMFFSPFLLHLMLFLKSFGSSFTVACFFQCSEVMVEYRLPSERKGEQFVPFAVNGDGCDQGCDLQTHRPAPVHTSTNTHKAMMMRPFPPSSPDPHLTTNEKHDNYPQLFAPQLSAVVILALIWSQLVVLPPLSLPLSNLSIPSSSSFVHLQELGIVTFQWRWWLLPNGFKDVTGNGDMIYLYSHWPVGDWQRLCWG